MGTSAITTSSQYGTDIATSAADAIASAASVSNPKAALDKDAFLKLLVAQMKNQDPDKPMDGTQMAAQLAQFSSVEQLMQINQALASQGTNNQTLTNSVNNSIALDSIGKTVYAAGDQVQLGAGQDATVHVAVSAAGQGKLTLTNAFGTVVGSRDLGTVQAGEQDIPLGGLEAGQPAGVYTYTLSVTDAKGNAIPVTSMVHGKVDGVTYTASGTNLTIGGISVPVSKIVTVKSS